jgi:hypothetical protein
VLDELPVSNTGLSEGFPVVRGYCPSCGRSSLFLGSGGYVTCAMHTCRDPGSASDLLFAQKAKIW